MSIMEIPDDRYEQLYLDEVAAGINSGLDLQAARQRAAEVMDGAFVARSIAIGREFSRDQYEYTEEMSFGGSIYEEPR